MNVEAPSVTLRYRLCREQTQLTTLCSVLQQVLPKHIAAILCLSYSVASHNTAIIDSVTNSGLLFLPMHTETAVSLP